MKRENLRHLPDLQFVYLHHKYIKVYWVLSTAVKLQLQNSHCRVFIEIYILSLCTHKTKGS